VTDKNTLVVNLFGGPGSGKSTTMAGVFSELKWMNINCEQAPEFAKEKVWEGSTSILDNQIYIFGKQLHSLFRLNGKVDIIVTDSPILLSLIYGKKNGENFGKLVLEKHYDFRNLNVFLKRKKKYNPCGRLQNEEEAIEIDNKIKDMLGKNTIEHLVYEAGPQVVKKIVGKIIEIEKLDFKKK
jgi:hypothetical protein